MEDFIKITRGINAGKDLERDFVISIYETVEKEPFTLEEDEEARIRLEGAQANSLKKKQDLFNK
jgi:Sec7-like guanine-nucleotide exchange factor